MPETAQTLTDKLLRRLRDPDAIGFSRAFVRSMLSQAQRFVNGATRITTDTATLTTSPHQMFYPIAALFPDILRIETVFDDTRDLKKTSIKELVHLDLKWFRHTDTQFTMWAPVGRDFLVVYPAKTIESTVSLRYTKLTTILDGEAVPIDMPDQFTLHIMDLAEILLHMKERGFNDVGPVLKQFQARIDRFSDRVLPTP